MAATKRTIGGEDTNITFEDQQQINTFARKSARLQELKDEIEAKKKELQNLEDAGDELMLLEDDTAPIPYPCLFSAICVHVSMCGVVISQSNPQRVFRMDQLKQNTKLSDLVRL
ncbi:PREDICTED: prefoldin subunit 4-like [Acropora digitifera]|uniref:prefoldin subunit 4-like n=1 Tax=Acropora digitifera TaxID=70779 RepID=UPI00077ABC66|nr:PREDICTED: prefoldin subunit 4-like [Acropora digitifera]